MDANRLLLNIKEGPAIFYKHTHTHTVKDTMFKLK